MNRTSVNYLKVSMLVLFAVFAMVILSGPATAGDYTMQTNLNEVADQLARWSKQSSTEKMTAQAQAELSKLLLETSRVLKEMAEKSSGEMDMDHHNKIEMMKKAWDPFDTEGRM